MFLRCSLNKDNIVYKYSYFKADHKTKAIDLVNENTQEKSHNIVDFNIPEGEETIENFEYSEFEIKDDIFLCFFIFSEYLLSLNIDLEKNTINSIAFRFPMNIYSEMTKLKNEKGKNFLIKGAGAKKALICFNL